MVREPDEIQPELFDQFADSNLKPKREKHRRVTRKRLLPHFTFTFSYENVIVFIIVLIILIVVSFSLGMERGKRLVDSTAAPLRSEAAVVPLPCRVQVNATPAERTLKGKGTDQGGVKESNFKKNVSKPPLAKEKKEKNQAYTIQVATFRQKLLAEKEISRLKKLNYNSFSRASGKFYLVFTGSYAAKELAGQDLKELRKIYKDCFIKRVKSRE